MKRKTTLTKLSGDVDGKKVSILHHSATSTQDCHFPDDILYWGDEQIALGSNLTPTLSRLMPNGYLTSRAKNAQVWAGFLEYANQQGRMSPRA